MNATTLILRTELIKSTNLKDVQIHSPAKLNGPIIFRNQKCFLCYLQLSGPQTLFVPFNVHLVVLHHADNYALAPLSRTRPISLRVFPILFHLFIYKILINQWPWRLPSLIAIDLFSRRLHLIPHSLPRNPEDPRFSLALLV